MAALGCSCVIHEGPARVKGRVGQGLVASSDVAGHGRLAQRVRSRNLAPAMS